MPILEGVADMASDLELDRWGDDVRLVELLGEQGAAGFRALFDSFPDAVGVLWALRDDAGRLRDFAFGYGNPSMLRSFRLPPSTPESYTLLEALPRMDGSRAFEAYVRTCETGVAWVKEITYDMPFGDGYMLGTFVHRIAKLGDGLIVFLTDVTDQRRIESELRNYADVVAHDLREPLSGMAVLVTLLERRAHEPPSPEALRLLRESTERARELIDGALEYASVGELRRERVGLDCLVAEVAEDLAPALEEAGAALEVDGDLPDVDADPRQLRRVLQNLVGNAIKFRGEAPPRVEIGAGRSDGEWSFRVSDNGIGIDEAYAERVFVIFQRLHAKELYPGTGIGLALCKKIVEFHGGRIWIDTGVASGTTVCWTLPVPDAVEEVEEVAQIEEGDRE
jgi:signal transduction histidine kinase